MPHEPSYSRSAHDFRAVKLCLQHRTDHQERSGNGQNRGEEYRMGWMGRRPFDRFEAGASCARAGRPASPERSGFGAETALLAGLRR